MQRTGSALSVVNAPAVVSTPESDNTLERHVRELQEAITRRAHELWESSGFPAGRDMENWLRAESELLHFVPVEITDNGDEVRVYAEVPGFNARDVDIHAEPKRLIIRGKNEQTREKTKGEVCYTEREGNQIFRAVNLPVEIDPNNASASLRDGVLEIALPKVGSAKATRVQVKAA
ncbi:MAG TPA: Hsp20 family protein [candidate division Zixibacteria bacterium]|nr:Hsp20 family protein [candidate division Zixibacteria bacterium]